MDISAINSETLLNPTLGTSRAGFTGLSNDQIFFNPSLDKVPKTDYIELTKEDYLELEAAKINYNQQGILFSKTPINAVQPSYDLADQAALLQKDQEVQALSKDFINKFYLQQESQQQGQGPIEIGNNLDLQA